MSTLIEPPDHSTRGHHPLGPSGTNYRDPRVGGCLGFVNRESADTSAADEGTENHELLDAAVREWVRHKCEGSVTDYFPGEISDWTSAHLHYVAQQIEPIVMTADEIHPEIMIELHRDDNSLINYGFADLLSIQGASATLDDYKFGWVPVKPAQINRQGWNYASGIFQMFPRVQEITVRFIQPKHRWVTQHTFNRADDADRLRSEIDRINRGSEEVRRTRDPDKMNPGTACDYCKFAGSCKAYLRMFDLGKERSGLLPELPSWSAETMSTPQEAAAAMAWLGVFETGAAEIKKKALEIARAHEDGIYVQSDQGDTFAWEVATRKGPSKIPSTKEFVQVLEDMGVPRIAFESAFSISKTEAVKGAVDYLKQTTRADDTKKAIGESVETTLKVSGVLEEGEPFDYLKKRREAKK